MSSPFGELVLLLGDLHIPYRQQLNKSGNNTSLMDFIPPKFAKMLVPGKMQYVLCTGNLGAHAYSKAVHEELLSVLVPSPNVHVVMGDYDIPGSGDTASYPETKVLQIGQFRIGLIHGHQVVPWGDHASLAAVRRRLDVDILVHGHTHKHEVLQYEGFYHINPGSITGAYSTFRPTDEFSSIEPSFILLSVQGDKVVAYSYELKSDEVDVSKAEFSKRDLPRK